MLSLLRTEFYRTLRDKRLYLFVIVTFFFFYFFWNIIPIRSAGWIRTYIDDFSLAPLGAGFGYLELVDESEDNIAAFINFYIRLHVPKIFPELWGMGIFTIYCSALLVGTRFTQRTITVPLSQGYSRGKVFTAVTIHYFATVAFVLLLSFFGLLFIKFNTLWISQFTPEYFFRSLGIWLWVSLALLSMNYAAAFAMKNVFGTILVNIGLFVLQNIILFVPRLLDYMGKEHVMELGKDFRSYVPLKLLADTSMWQLDRLFTVREGLFLILYPLAIIVCSIFVAWRCFRRRDLR